MCVCVYVCVSARARACARVRACCVLAQLQASYRRTHPPTHPPTHLPAKANKVQEKARQKEEKARHKEKQVSNDLLLSEFPPMKVEERAPAPPRNEWLDAEALPGVTDALPGGTTLVIQKRLLGEVTRFDATWDGPEDDALELGLDFKGSTNLMIFDPAEIKGLLVDTIVQGGGKAVFLCKVTSAGSELGPSSIHLSHTASTPKAVKEVLAKKAEQAAYDVVAAEASAAEAKAKAEKAKSSAQDARDVG